MAKKVKLIEPSEVRSRLLKLVAKNCFEWNDVLEEFSEYSGNWLRIRGVLQGLINDKIIKRADDIFTETYFAI